jgi:hypothetical protein
VLDLAMIDTLWHSTPPPPHLSIEPTLRSRFRDGLLRDDKTRTLAESKELEKAY